MPQPIQFYFDFSSPYAYFASHKIDALAASHKRSVTWRPFLVGAAMRVSGNAPLAEQPLKGDYAKHDWERLGRYMQAPWVLPAVFPVATHAAARAFYWIEDQKGQDAARLFAQAIFHAYFGLGRDIHPAETVADIASALGHDAEKLLAAVEGQELKQRLKDVNEAALSQGVFGSPFFIVDGEAFWGADRLWMVKHWLERGGF